MYIAIGRTLIPRYFRSIFEGGVTELYYNMKHPKESFHNTSITLDCDQCTMITHHGKPLFTKVRIKHKLPKSYHFLIKKIGQILTLLSLKILWFWWKVSCKICSILKILSFHPCYENNLYPNAIDFHLRIEFKPP